MFPEWETYDEDESDRWDSLALRKARGKGNPKKKRTPEGEFYYLRVCGGTVLMCHCRVEEVCEEETYCGCEGGACGLSDIIRPLGFNWGVCGMGEGVMYLFCIAMALGFGISHSKTGCADAEYQMVLYSIYKNHGIQNHHAYHQTYRCYRRH